MARFHLCFQRMTQDDRPPETPYTTLRAQMMGKYQHIHTKILGPNLYDTGPFQAHGEQDSASSINVYQRAGSLARQEQLY